MRIKISFRNNRVFDTVLICLLALISFCCFLYRFHYLDPKTYIYDEGIIVNGAVSVLDGKIPYRDFWTLYAPGIFYIIAAIFKLFGISLMAERLFATLILSLTVCGVYLLLRRLTSRSLSLFGFLLVLIWLRTYMVFNRPAQLAVLFIILCGFSVINFINSNRNIWLFVAGILSGIAGLFRQDFGFYIFASVFIVSLLKQLNWVKQESWRFELTGVFKKIFYLFCGCSVIIFPLVIYLLFNSASEEFIHNVIIFPITIYPKVRDLPYPQLKVNTLIFYSLPFIFVLTGIRLLFYNWRNEVNDRNAWIMLFFLFCGIGLFNYTNVRIDIEHLLPTMVIAIILFILLIDNFRKDILTSRMYYRRNPFGITIGFVLLSILMASSFMKYNNLSGWIRDRNPVDISRAQGFYYDSKAVQSQILAVQYIQSRTSQDENIFVGNLRHDKVFCNDLMFYFFSQRNSATKYYELHPGLTNTRKIQEAIIDDLSKADVRYIVLWSGSEDVNEPNESSKNSGIIELDDFIQKNYRIEKVFDSYLVLRRI